MVDEEFPVLVCGGGVVGLCAALFLERAGVRACVVERHPTTSIHPRSRGVNGRTMELMRELGLEQAVRAAGTKLAPAVGIYRGDNLRAVLAARRDGGWLLRRLRRRMSQGRPTPHSPTGPCRCTQDELEPVLLDALRTRGVDARLSTELTQLEQTDDAVIATLRDRATGAERRVRARYLIAADGARSHIREQLGIARSTHVPGSHQMNLYFRADLGALVRGREFSMCLIEQPSLLGLIASINNSDLWVLHVAYAPERGEQPSDFTSERCVELIRRATGIPELEVEAKGVLPWESALRIADRYRAGRVFLAGDAAHIMPPWGGFGANTGIQDAHNLAWKLGAVLHGQAGPGLLDSYEAERRPVALEVGAIAASMNDARGLMTIERSPLAMLWKLRKVIRYLGVGYGYASTAIALEPGVPPGPTSNDLRGRPGTRTPHVWFAGGSEPRSSLDWLGRGHVLWLGPRADVWAQAAQLAAAAHSGVSLRVVHLGKDVPEQKLRAARAFGIGLRGALLVRPDGFVAFRAGGAPRSVEQGTGELRAVLSRICSFSTLPTPTHRPSVTHTG